MPADLVEAAGGEAHRQRTVLLFRYGLVRVEDEVVHVLRHLRREAQRHGHGILLIGPERPFGELPQVERRIARELFLGEAGAADVRQPPQAHAAAPFGMADQEGAVAVDDAVGLHAAPVALPGGLRQVVERHRPPALDGGAQQAEQTFVETRPRARPHRHAFRHHQRLQIGFEAGPRFGLQQRAQLVGELAQLGGAFFQPVAFQRRRGRGQFRQFVRGHGYQAAQRARPQPQVLLALAGIHRLKLAKEVSDRVPQPLGGAPRDFELPFDVVQREPAPRCLQPQRQFDDVHRPLVRHTPPAASPYVVLR